MDDPSDQAAARPPPSASAPRGLRWRRVLKYQHHRRAERLGGLAGAAVGCLAILGALSLLGSRGLEPSSFLLGLCLALSAGGVALGSRLAGAVWRRTLRPGRGGTAPTRATRRPAAQRRQLLKGPALPATILSVGLGLALSPLAAAERTGVQGVPCETGRELRLARDGTVSACRLAAAAELLVGLAGGNGKVACAAGGQVEFHRNGYLSFCDPAGAAGTYVTRGRRSTSCKTDGRVAFDENGYLEYCR